MKTLPLLPLNEDEFWDIAQSQHPEWFSSDVSEVNGQSVSEWSQINKKTVKVVFTSSESDPDSGYENTYKFHCVMKFDEQVGWCIDEYQVDV
tara:strand:- start:1139 stop:1414 length:276 start_codon:yes stop_codon:yes gene_type:complete